MINWYLICLSLLMSASANEIAGSSEQQPIQDSSGRQKPFDSSFDEFVQDLLKECHVPGLSVAIIEDGKISSKGYGFATLPNQKATADTQYFTASTTKAFTAAAAALIIHDTDNYPNTQWTTPINSIIRDDFVLEDEWATNHITIQDALSHRTGLPGHDSFYGQPGDTPQKVIQRLRYLPMTEAPRTEWQYCNVMYTVITHVIETLTNRPLEDVLREWLWEPLGMSSTVFDAPFTNGQPSKLGPRVATGYYWNAKSKEEDSDGEHVPERRVDLRCTSGDGAIISTVNDYALWMKALMNAAGNEESWNTSSPISRALYRDLVYPRSIIPAFGFPDETETFVPPLYALGWYTATLARQHLLYHSGGIPGFGTEVVMLPGLKYGVVTMQNVLSTTSCDPGPIILSRLLLDKLGLNDSDESHGTVFRNNLFDATETTRAARQPWESSRPKPFTPPSKDDGLHLPLPLADFAGLYNHPAYGDFNLTIGPVPSDSSAEELSGLLHPRSEAVKEVFSHISGTLFRVRSFEPHGRGDIATGQGIVWEDLSDEDGETYAIFELGADGRSVEMLGIELDDDMIRKVREGDWKGWKDGMIWFRRVQ